MATLSCNNRALLYLTNVELASWERAGSDTIPIRTKESETVQMSKVIQKWEKVLTLILVTAGCISLDN